MGEFDPIERPKHYNSHPSRVQPIDIGEHLAANLFAALKYCWRRDLKGDARQDLEKASWFLERQKRLLDLMQDLPSVMPGSEAVVRLLAQRVIETAEGDLLRDVLQIVMNLAAGGEPRKQLEIWLHHVATELEKHQ